jgi:hypothetical protein
MIRRFVLLFMACLAGCHRYDPAPLKLSNYAQRWQQTTLDIEPVRAFAETLRRSAVVDPGPFDLSDGVALHEAEALALHFNPRLQAARAAAQIPLASAENAGWWPDPQFEAEILRFTDRVGRHQGRDRGEPQGFIEDPWLIGGSLRITIPISGRLAVEQDLEWSHHGAVWCDAIVLEWQVVTALRNAWFEWSAASERVAVAQAYLEQFENIANIAGELATAGELQPTDARVLRIEAARQRTALMELRGAVEQVRFQILAHLGVSPETALVLTRSAEIAAIAYAQEERTTQIIAAHPKIKAAQAEYAVTEQALRLEIRKQYPDVDVGPSFSFDEGFYRGGFGIGVPIPLWNRNRQGIAEAVAARQAARLHTEAEVQSALAQLARLEAQLKRATERRSHLESQVAPIVDQQVEDSRTLLNLGEIDVLVLRDAVTSSLTTKLSILAAIAAEARAANELAQMLSPRWMTPSGGKGEQ